MNDHNGQQGQKKPRIFFLSDDLFKTLCHADKKGLDPSVGLENLIHMYLSLAGPINFSQLDLERAHMIFKKNHVEE
jgi:hypothetical protein